MVRQSAYVHGATTTKNLHYSNNGYTERNTTSRLTLEGIHSHTHFVLLHTQTLNLEFSLYLTLLYSTRWTHRFFYLFCTIANASIYRQIYACILHARPSLGREFHKSSLFHAQCFHATLMHALPFLTLQPPTTPIYIGCSLAFQQMHAALYHV